MEGSFNAAFSETRRKLKKLVKAVPVASMKPGNDGDHWLTKCLEGFLECAYEAGEDPRLVEAHVLAKFDQARPVLAAGLYSKNADCKVLTVMSLPHFVKDGDLERGFPAFWRPFEYLMELLDADTWEVVGQAALCIGSLCTCDFTCVGPSPSLKHVATFWDLGAVDKMLRLMTHPPHKRVDSSYTIEEAQMEMCYALPPLLSNPIIRGIPKVKEAPGFIPRVVDLVSCPYKNGEVQCMAIGCLNQLARMCLDFAATIKRIGGKEAAEKVLEKPFAVKRAPFLGPGEGRNEKAQQQASILLAALKCVPPSKLREKSRPSLVSVDQMSVKELKALLLEHRVDHQGCLEKADLQKKARALVAPTADNLRASSNGTASAPAREKDRATTPSVASVPTEMADIAPVADMSNKELREKLTQLHVSTAGCIERQDLVDRLTSAMQKQGGDSAASKPKDGVPESEVPPSLGSQTAQDTSDEAFVASVMGVLSAPKNAEARQAANELIFEMLRDGDQPFGVSLESAVWMIVKGHNDVVRASGLKVLTAALMKGSHQLREDLADAGVLKAAVRLLSVSDDERDARLEALDTLGQFSRTQSLAPKLWEYGVMGPLAEEFFRPAVLQGMADKHPGMVQVVWYLSGGVIMSLRIIANMMQPRVLQAVNMPAATFGTTNSGSLPASDAFTRKVGRWVLRNNIHKQAAKLLALVFQLRWCRLPEAEPHDTNTVALQSTRLLMQLVASQKSADTVATIPGLATSLVYLTEQWETSEPECSVAALFLTVISTLHGGTLAHFCCRSEVVRIRDNMEESLKLPRGPSSSHTPREQLLTVVRHDLRQDTSSFTATYVRAWCDALRSETDLEVAEKIVRNILGECGGSSYEKLYGFKFWPALAQHAGRATPDKQTLLARFAESFNLHPPESGFLSRSARVNELLQMPEPLRTRVILQLLSAGVVRALEKAAQRDDTVGHVFNFYEYIARDVEVGSTLAEAILGDPDLLPFVLRFALLNLGCSAGVAEAKITLICLLRLTPWGSNRGPLTAGDLIKVRPEMDPTRPPDSIRYDLLEGHIYVGEKHIAKATRSAFNFGSNLREAIAGHNLSDCDVPFDTQGLKDLGKGNSSGPPIPRKQKECVVCGKTGAKSKCSRCRQRVYCGRDCQLADWRTHKLTCQPKAA